MRRDVLEGLRRLALLLAISAPVATTHADGQPLRFVHLTQAAGQSADESRPPANGEPIDWHVQIEPMLRYVGPAGDVRLPGGGVRGSFVDLADVDLNSPRLMPGFDLNLRHGDWRINAIGLFYDIDDRTAVTEENFTLGGIDFAPMERSSLSHTYTQIDVRLAYTIVDRPLRPLSDAQGHKVRFRLDAEAGLRLYDFEFEFENLDTAERGSDDRTFLEPHAGFKAGFTLYEDLTIDLYTNFGLWPFDAEAFSWDIGVGFQWRPVDYLGLQIGYRSTIFRLNEGSGVNEFEWEGSYQGLYAGLQFRF